jgi:hypothetical protein
VQGWADLFELAAMLEAGLQALTEHRGSLWLADAHKMQVINQPDQDWIVREFFPRALAAGLRRFALVIPNERATTAVDQFLVSLPAKFEAACFATEDEARSWLNTFTAT